MQSPDQNQLKAPHEHRNVAQWLRHKADLKLRTGVLGGKRVDYFKGRAAVKALVSPAYQKLSNVPSVTDEASAEKLLSALIPSTFYLRVERGDHLPPPPNPQGSSGGSTPAKQPRSLRVAQQQFYKQDEYFVWLIPASQLKTTLGAIALVTVVLAGCMFPLWPVKLRIGVWYLSIGVLGLIAALVVIAIVRLIIWGITKLLLKPGIWIFPRLFDDLGVIESFQPLWGWDLPPPKKAKRRSKKTQDPQAEIKTSGKSTAKAASSASSSPPTQRNGHVTKLQKASIEEVAE